MPSPQITNPKGSYGLAADSSGVTWVEVVNNSGGTLLPGDVVVFAADTTGALATTTTTASDPTVLGVVAAKTPTDSLNTQASTDTYASGAVMPVIVRGPARINIGANTVAATAALATDSAVKKAAVPGAAASVAALQALAGSWIGIALESQAAKDANNTIRAYINKS